MTTDETIEQQARMEAEERHPPDMLHWEHGAQRTYSMRQYERMQAYAAALIAERSKPQPSVDEVMEEVEQWQDEVVDGLNNPEGNDVGLDQLRDRLTKLFNK